MQLDPELQAKIQIWRRKAMDGTLAPDEMREAIVALREGRAAASATVRAKKAAKAVLSADDLLKELGEL